VSRFNHRKRFTSACDFIAIPYRHFTIHGLPRMSEAEHVNMMSMFRHVGRNTVPYFITRRGFRLLAYGPFVSKKEAMQWVDVLLDQPMHKDWLNRTEAAFEAMKALGVLRYELAG